jgi:hypothetical protein
MAQRGRKSAASMEVAALAAPIGSARRLEAPAHLSDAERAVFIELINDQPASAFSATHAPLIELYCRHVVQARVLSEELLNFDRNWLADDDGLKRYDRLLAMAERESRAASSLATRLRITRQAIDQQTVARALINAPKAKKKPWELTLESE